MKKKIVIITPPSKKGYFYDMWEENQKSKTKWIGLDISKDKFKKEFMCDFTK